MTDNNQEFSPTISWDFGTAYEFFISLHVLHQPDTFGLRPSWAAGVRSRIPAAERKLMEDVIPVFAMPIKWVSELPEPKDAITALWALKQIPPAERMPALLKLNEPYYNENPAEQEIHDTFKATLMRIASDGK